MLSRRERKDLAELEGSCYCSPACCPLIYLSVRRVHYAKEKTSRMGDEGKGRKKRQRAADGERGLSRAKEEKRWKDGRSGKYGRNKRRKISLAFSLSHGTSRFVITADSVRTV